MQRCMRTAMVDERLVRREVLRCSLTRGHDGRHLAKRRSGGYVSWLIVDDENGGEQQTRFEWEKVSKEEAQEIFSQFGFKKKTKEKERKGAA